MSETALTRFLAEQTATRLREMKGELREELEKTYRRAEEIEADIARVEMALNERPKGRRGGSRSSAPTRTRAASRGSANSPSLKDAILQILASRPQEVWATQDVLDALETNGLAPGGQKPLNTVGNRMIELAKAKKIYRHNPGIYSLSPPGPSLLSTDGGGDSG